MVAQLLAHIDTLDAAMQNLSERIEFVLTPHAQIIELLCTIPGVQAHAAQVLIAECGLDMTLFPTVGHFASWAGACPGHHQSAGRQALRADPSRAALAHRPAHRMRPRRGPHQRDLPRRALRAAPRPARRAKAIGAIRHDLLVAYFHIVRDQVPYRDLGPDWQRKRYSVEHRARRLQRQLEALGYAVTLDQADHSLNKPPDPTTNPSRATADRAPGGRATLPANTRGNTRGFTGQPPAALRRTTSPGAGQFVEISTRGSAPAAPSRRLPSCRRRGPPVNAV